MTPSGEHYDAVQRHIRYNHVAVVRRGRAGVARLNMDGDEVISHKEEKEMVKIKLDNGIEYDVPPEVGAAVKAMREDGAKQKDAMDALQAKLDSAEAQVKDLTAAAEKLKEEQKKHFDAAVSARVALLDAAGEAGVEKADGMSEMDGLVQDIDWGLHQNSGSKGGKSLVQIALVGAGISKEGFSALMAVEASDNLPSAGSRLAGERQEKLHNMKNRQALRDSQAVPGIY